MTLRREKLSSAFFFAPAAVLCLTLCSCRTFNAAKIEPQIKSASVVQPIAPQPPVVTGAYYSPALPQPTWSAMQVAHQQQCACGGHHGGCKPSFQFSESMPGSCDVTSPETWAPDGLERPWPRDEYVWDGGDRNADFRVTKKNEVYGLDPEDTVAHFESEPGCPEVAVANRVPIYAPRFAAVRHVTEVLGSDQSERLGQADRNTKLVAETDLRIVSSMNQPLQPIAGIGTDQAETFEDRTAGVTAENTLHLSQAQLGFLPLEFRDLLGNRELNNTEKLRLAQLSLGASTWSRNQPVQVVVDDVLPLESRSDVKVGTTIAYDRKGCPRLRIMKLADKSEAQPGDIVSFTIRFDNVGEQKLNKIMILDNLTTRLEYIEDSQECSHKANFVVEPNEGDSFTLRWEIADAMRVGEGGIIKFKCRMR